VIRGSALRCTALLAALAAVGLLAGCTSSGQPQAVRNTLPSIASTPPTTAASTRPSTPPPPTSAPPTSAPPVRSSTPAPSTPARTTTSSAVPPVPPVPQTTCKSLSVRVLPGGASFGEQIAGLQFTNEGSSSCVLAGYPTVTLLLHGQVIGRPSEPATPAKSTRTLKPGQVAESLLHDYTQTCQAPLSDSVRVQVPGTPQTVIRPGMQLRACVLRVDRLTPPE
jgi:hypothetical protein